MWDSIAWSSLRELSVGPQTYLSDEASSVYVQVQIVNFGLEYPLKRLADELAQACRATDIRIIVIDNASTVRSRSYIAKSFASVEEYLVIVCSNKNLGFSAGHNLGISEYWSGKEELVIVNPDIGKGLAEAIRMLRHHYSTDDGLLGFPIVETSQNIVRTVGRYNRWSSKLQFDERKYPVGTTHQCSEPLTCPSGALLGIGPRLLVSLGGALPRLTFLYLEELLLAEEARWRGESVFVARHPTVHHDGGTRRSRSPLRAAALISSSYLVEEWLSARYGNTLPRAGPLVRTVREMMFQHPRNWSRTAELTQGIVRDVMDA